MLEKLLENLWKDFAELCKELDKDNRGLALINFNLAEIRQLLDQHPIHKLCFNQNPLIESHLAVAYRRLAAYEKMYGDLRVRQTG